MTLVYFTFLLVVLIMFYIDMACFEHAVNAATRFVSDISSNLTSLASLAFPTTLVSGLEEYHVTLLYTINPICQLICQ